MEIAIGKETRNTGVCRLARLARVSASHMSRVLAGQRKPGAALAARLARMGVRACG